jgi:hypothetical protein
VIDGEDQGRHFQAVNWQGGGGFRYYSLAPSLIVNDRWGNPVINPEYNAAQLAEALAKLEGFTYAPSETALVAARPLQRARLHLRHHAELVCRPVAGALR